MAATTMRGTNHSDRNLFFNVNRERLFDPQLRGDIIPAMYGTHGGLMDIQAATQAYPAVSGGGDRNLHFELYRMGRLRKQPTLQRRIFNDLDPKTRVIESLDVTKKQRQASLMVAGIQGIKDVLALALTVPVVDAAGDPVLDEKGEPVLQPKPVKDFLKLAADSVKKMLSDNDIRPSQNLNDIIDTFTVENARNALDKAQAAVAANAGADQKAQEDMIVSSILWERLRNMDDVAGDTLQRKIQREVVDLNLIDGDWTRPGGYTNNIVTPRIYADNPAKFQALVFTALHDHGAGVMSALRIAGREEGVPPDRYGAMFRAGRNFNLNTGRFGGRAPARAEGAPPPRGAPAPPGQPVRHRQSALAFGSAQPRFI